MGYTVLVLDLITSKEELMKRNEKYSLNAVYLELHYVAASVPLAGPVDFCTPSFGRILLSSVLESFFTSRKFTFLQLCKVTIKTCEITQNYGSLKITLIRSQGRACRPNYGTCPVNSILPKSQLPHIACSVGFLLQAHARLLWTLNLAPGSEK